MTRPRALLGSLIVADVAFAFLQTAIIPAIPVVRHDLAMSEAWSAWLLSAYLMVATAATPALGRLADLYGRRRVLLVSLATFLAGAVGAALAPGSAVLVFFRAVQGVGGAVFPLTFALVREELPAERVRLAIGTLTGAFGIGTALGFGLGGLLAVHLSWRVIFAAGACAVALGTVLVARTVAARPGTAHGRFDLVGALLVGTAAVTLLLALTFGTELGWASPVPPVLFALSAGGWFWWARRELTAADPLVDITLFRIRSVVLANLATMGLGWAMFGAYLLLPDLLGAAPGRAGYGFGASATVVGLCLLPAAAGQMVAGPLAVRAASVLGARRVFAGGLALVALALASLSVIRSGWPQLVAAVLVLGLGIGFAIQTSSAVVTEGVGAEHAAISTTLNSTIRRFAGGVGGQVSVGILAALTRGGGRTPAPAAFTLGFLVAAAMVAAGAGLAGAARSTR
ncbi:MAG TPA: MFS transporter [Streptosporangiales bacterium]